MLLARNINMFDVKIMPKVKHGRVNIWCRFKSIKSKYLKKFTFKNLIDSNSWIQNKAVFVFKLYVYRF